MNKYQVSHTLMFSKVINIMDQNKTIWEHDTIISQIMDKVNKNQTAIYVTIQEQKLDIRAFTDKKSNSRDLVDNDLNSLLAALRTFAKLTGNEVLFREASMSRTAIRDIFDVEIGQVFDKFLTFANDHSAELEPYGITEAGLKAYQDHLNAYDKNMNLPRTMIAVRKTATDKLQPQIDDQSSVLNDVLDNAMEKYRETEYDFYHQYVNARIIIDAAYRHRSVFGIFTDEETGEVLDYVEVKFRPGSELANTVKLANTRSTDKGSYEMAGLPFGQGTLTFEKPYYDTLHMDVEIIPHRTVHLDVALRKKE